MRDDVESREQLIHHANETRAMFLQTVEQLARRRHEAFDLRIQLERHFSKIVVTAVVLLLAEAGAVALIARRLAIRRRRRAGWSLATHFRRSPDSIVRTPHRPFLGELAGALLLPILSAAARRAMTFVSSGKRSDTSAPMA